MPAAMAGLHHMQTANNNPEFLAQSARLATLQAELTNSTRISNESVLATRCQNTTKTYNAKQAEFTKWCATKFEGLRDWSVESWHNGSNEFELTIEREIVTGEKLNHFLQERVVNRPRKRALMAAPKPKRKRQKDAHPDTEAASSSAPESVAVPDADGVDTVTAAVSVDGPQPNLIRQTVSGSTVNLYVAAVVDIYKQQVAMRMNNHPHPREGTVKNFLGGLRKTSELKRRLEHVDRGAGDTYDEDFLRM